MNSCPAGHETEATDYCDVCGIAMSADGGNGDAATKPDDTATFSTLDPAADGGSDGTCPNCRATNPTDALFCEACGYDFTTGSMPRPLAPPDATPTDAAAPPAPVDAPPIAVPAEKFDWVAEVWIDPAWYEAQESPDPMPSPGLPDVVPLRAESLLVGRTSRSRDIHPQIDCASDSGVSRRQAQLTTDGTRWWVEDLDSANGTFVAPASAALPEDPIPVGQKRELAPDDRVYLGAWTRIVIRQATEDERTTLG